MITIVPDVGAPALVIGADLVTQKYAPEWNEWASYIMAAGGYLASGFGLARGTAGEFLKNMGIAALPLAARHIQARVGVTQPVTSRSVASRLQFRSGPIRQPVNRQYQPEFEGAGAHAI